MATFLELVNTARREAGVSNGVDLPSLGGPLSWEGRRFKGWVGEAWADIQTSRPDWLWMQDEFTFQTAPGVGEYAAASLAPTPLTRFANWKPNSLSLYSAPADERELCQWDWSQFRPSYRFGAQGQQQGRPVAYAVAPAGTLQFGYIPDAAYTVRGEYFKSPQVLVGDGDVPEMPERFHRLIVYGALLRAGIYEAAPELVTRGQQELGPLYSRLVHDQSPGISFAAPLA